MFLLKKILTALALPPLSLLLLGGFGVLIGRRFPRTGRWLAGLSLLALALLSLPIVSIALLHSLETVPPITPARLAQAEAIVILGGGLYADAPEYGSDTVSAATLERLRYGAMLQRQSGLPVLVTGGAPSGGRPEAEAMKETLEKEFGGRVRWVENRSHDTAENASFSAATLWPARITRIALVTHAWHMPRALVSFEKSGLDVVAAPTAYSTWPPLSARLVLPSAYALARSSLALHEWLGIAVQRLVR